MDCDKIAEKKKHSKPNIQLYTMQKCDSSTVMYFQYFGSCELQNHDPNHESSPEGQTRLGAQFLAFDSF